jgi:hypothetical protein
LSSRKKEEAKKNGRPSKKNQPTGETISDKIISAIRNGMSEKVASEFAGITEQTLANWKNTDPTFFSNIKKAHAEARHWWCMKLRESAEVAAARGNCTPMMFWLSRRAKDEFGEDNNNIPIMPKVLIIDNAK